MKKLIIILMVCFVVIPSISSTMPLIAKCDDSGAVTIYSDQNIDCKIYASKDRKEWFDVPGEWNSDLTRFKSEDMVLNDNFNYGLKVVYPNFNYIMDTYCPGYKFSCKKLNISINTCYKRAGVFSAEFNSINQNGIYDLKYIFETDKGRFVIHGPSMYSKETENITISSLGDNNYLLNLKTKLNITKFSITHDKCNNKNDKYYRYAEEYCNKSFCIENKNCKANEYCDKNFLCTPLQCNTCEKILNHSCIPKCNDNNPCSEDKCFEGKCKFTITNGCKLNDTCIPQEHIRTINNISYFCNSSNEFVPQKKANESCSYDYECLNGCINNICSEKEKETVNVIQKIIDFFKRLFNF